MYFVVMDSPIFTMVSVLEIVGIFVTLPVGMVEAFSFPGTISNSMLLELTMTVANLFPSLKISQLLPELV